MLLYIDLLYRLQLRDEEGMKANLVVLAAYEYTDEDEDNTGIELQAILMARTTISLPTMHAMTSEKNYESVIETLTRSMVYKEIHV